METKICTQCGRELPIEQFYWRDKKNNLRRSECKDCHNNYVKNKYQDNKNKINFLKTKLKCAKCGDDRYYVLDFHHIDPQEKEKPVSRLLSSSASENHLQNEIDKCICLCANCHREFHYLNTLNNITLQEYLSQ